MDANERTAGAKNNSKCKSLSQGLIRLWRKNSIRQLADKSKVKSFFAPLLNFFGDSTV